MKIKADGSVCIGAGQCAMHAPKLFRQNEETGLVEVLKPDADESDREELDMAVMACPVRAVSYTE